MKLSAHTVANAFAWAVIVVLLGVAFVMVLLIGPFGLILLGLFTMFICTSFGLRDDVPTWGVEVFKARMNDDRSPDRRAARQAEKREDLSAARFFNRCGIVLTVAGISGVVWEQFR